MAAPQGAPDAAHRGVHAHPHSIGADRGELLRNSGWAARRTRVCRGPECRLLSGSLRQCIIDSWQGCVFSSIAGTRPIPLGSKVAMPAGNWTQNSRGLTCEDEAHHCMHH